MAAQGGFAASEINAKTPNRAKVAIREQGLTRALHERSLEQNAIKEVLGALGRLGLLAFLLRRRRR